MIYTFYKYQIIGFSHMFAVFGDFPLYTDYMYWLNTFENYFDKLALRFVLLVSAFFCEFFFVCCCCFLLNLFKLMSLSFSLSSSFTLLAFIRLVTRCRATTFTLNAKCIYNFFEFSLSIIDTFNDIIRHDNRQQRPIFSLYMFINVYKPIDARLKFICPIGGSSIILSIFETNKQKKHNNSEDKTSTRLKMTNRVTRICTRIHSNTHPKYTDTNTVFARIHQWYDQVLLTIIINKLICNAFMPINIFSAIFRILIISASFLFLHKICSIKLILLWYDLKKYLKWPQNFDIINKYKLL